MGSIPVTRVLISVSDKSGIVDFARAISKLGIEILSTGGTSKLLIDNGIGVRSVDSYTGFPEIMDGRVKTLHPKIHGGILAIRDKETHISQMLANKIEPIDMVVINLYPFKETISRPDVTLEDAIENIDIGGPAMIRSAAKNHSYVTIAVDSLDYPGILAELTASRVVLEKTRRRLAAKAFSHTAAYDTMIASYLTQKFES